MAMTCTWNCCGVDTLMSFLILDSLTHAHLVPARRPFFHETHLNQPRCVRCELLVSGRAISSPKIWKISIRYPKCFGWNGTTKQNYYYGIPTLETTNKNMPKVGWPWEILWDFPLEFPGLRFQELIKTWYPKQPVFLMVVSTGWFQIFTLKMVGNHQTSIQTWLFRVYTREKNPIECSMKLNCKHQSSLFPRSTTAISLTRRWGKKN